MEMSDAGIALLKEFEGCRLSAYRCPAGVLTIGYGSTTQVHEGMTITQSEADERLTREVQHFASEVRSHVRVELTDNAFSALVCFAYNLGVGSLAGSTLLRLVNQGELESASHEFPKWAHCGGEILPGLLRRRQAEASLFLES